MKRIRNYFFFRYRKKFDLVHLLLLIPSLSTLNNFIMIVMFSFTLNILKYKIIFVLN